MNEVFYPKHVHILNHFRTKYILYFLVTRFSIKFIKKIEFKHYIV